MGDVHIAGYVGPDAVVHRKKLASRYILHIYSGQFTVFNWAFCGPMYGGSSERGVDRRENGARARSIFGFSIRPEQKEVKTCPRRTQIYDRRLSAIDYCRDNNYYIRHHSSMGIDSRRAPEAQPLGAGRSHDEEARLILRVSRWPLRSARVMGFTIPHSGLIDLTRSVP